jgi:uncharacterized OB-fold protein/acetyl-CoA acetyltransferase
VAEASGRPLPMVTTENEFFWTSGADGRLRFAGCASCSALIHPPQPVCRYCRGRSLAPREVSGKATLIGFTVNHRFGVPGLAPPYVIAQVAIEEDPRVRLTTNAVECDPDDLWLGMRMEVVFAEDGDVWLPLFRPAPAAEQPAEPAPLPKDEVEPGRMHSYVRPMATPEKFEDKVALTGIGMSRIGRRLMLPPLELTVQACERAVADAGLSLDDIDGLSTWPGAGMVGGFGEGGVTAVGPARAVLPDDLGVHLQRADETGEDLASGRPDHQLDVPVRRDLRRAHARHERPALHADESLGARTITTPFGLYDCDVPCDAAIAVIVSAKDAARDLAKPPVFVEATGTQLIERLEWDQSTLTHEPQVLGQSAHLWSRTSLRPEDVDVAELYDGFTFNCLSWIEGLGFCGIGEAKDFLDGGKNIARDGLLPLNTHGGQLSHGRTHGMGLIHEAITQLRGEGGERQIPGARVAIASTGGLAPSGILLLRKDE